MYRDMVKRIHRIEGGKTEWYMINRMRCTNEDCRRYHRQLPDCMVKFKHYSSETIEDVLDGVISEEDPLDGPGKQTMQNWREWFRINETNLEGQIRSAGYRILDLGYEFLRSSESLLGKIRESISNGWLGSVCRMVINSGGDLLVSEAG